MQIDKAVPLLRDHRFGIRRIGDSQRNLGCVDETVRSDLLQLLKFAPAAVKRA